MPPRNLFLSIALGALATLAHPFAFAAKAAAAAAASLRRSARPELDTGRWTLELLKRLEWRRFEELCGAYFESLGFRAEASRTGADATLGVLLYAQGAEKASILVHCKAWNAGVVGIQPLRALRAAMSAGVLGEGVFATSGRFTQEAREFAGKEKIDLIDGPGLLAKIGELPPAHAAALLEFATEGEYFIPTCPACDIKMTSQQSTGEGRKYWGCPNYPRCKQTYFSVANAPG